MSRPRILVVDDDRDVCFVAVRALESIGHCDAVHDVAHAVRALDHGRYDVALIDVTLPGASGLTLLDRFRQSWPQTAPLMLSGATDLAVAREAVDRGAIGYVSKPFRIRDLRIQVIAALGAAERSDNSARALARGRAVARARSLIEASDRTVCFVVEVEHVSLLNASYGVEAVDRLCNGVEERLRSVDGAIEVMGRLGPAAFAAALPLGTGVSPSEVAQAVLRALAVPAIVDARRIPIAARVGLALATPADDADVVLNLAEGAVVAARDCGHPFVVYDGRAGEPARLQQELLADATTAIDRGQLHVVYQPQHDVTTARCVGLEALARWRHPTHGDVPASIFIPLAERMELIHELGAQVLHTACADLARLRRSPDLSELRVSVNASASELRDQDYPERVARMLETAGLPASAVRLEVTESVALEETDAVDGVLADLQRLGIALSIDDFGTGYSSFSILARVPWSEIKLDRSLTVQHHEPRGREMLRAIVTYGTALSVDVIAEGIETVAQLHAIRALGCRYAQGYLLGRPQPISEMARELRRAAA